MHARSYRAGNCNHLLSNTARSPSIAIILQVLFEHDVNLFDSQPRLLTHFSHFWRQNSVILDSALYFLSPLSSIFDSQASFSFDEFQDCTNSNTVLSFSDSRIQICTNFPGYHLVGIVTSTIKFHSISYRILEDHRCEEQL